MRRTTADRYNEEGTVSPVEAAWLTELSPKSINATIDRGELKAVKRRGGGGKRRVRSLGPADVLYLMLRRELGAALSASAKRELYHRLTKARLGVLEGKSSREEQRDAQIELAGGVIRIELKTIYARLASRWRALRNASRNVVSDPKVRAGEPVIRGTRVPVYMIADLSKQGAGVSEILQDYPSLDRSRVEAAVAYAQMNPKRGRPSRLGRVHRRPAPPTTTGRGADSCNQQPG
jgi:uncharacterized protein (DUF433 family)